MRFTWQQQAGVARYEMRLSRNARFHLVVDVVTRRPAGTRVLADGTWWWKVRALSPKHSRWSEARRVQIKAKTDIIAPTRPRAPRVTARTRTSLRLAFGASQDAFGVKRYRVFLGKRTKPSAVVGRKARSATIKLKCSSAVQTLTVQAVDRAGNRSRRSPAARGRTLPCSSALTVPAGLRATASDQTSITLAWNAPKPSAGVGDYLVMRDGASLGRPRATTLRAAGLKPGTTYTFTVQARDKAGAVSRPAELKAATASAAQTSGKLHAHLLSSDSASFTDFQAHYNQISWVYITDFEVLVGPDGAPVVEGTYSAAIAHWAQARGIKVLPRFHSEDTAVLHAVLADPANRDALVGRIGAIVAAIGADGANIDFEGGHCPAANDCDRDALTDFAQKLAGVMHAQGRLFSIDVSAKTADTTSGRAAFYDYAKLGAVADEVLVMAWNPHYSTSMPGPVANALRTCAGVPCAWSQMVVDYAARLIPAARLTFATSLYAFDWSYRRVVGPKPVVPVNLRIGSGPPIGQSTTLVAPGQQLNAIPGTWLGGDGTPATYTWLRCPSFKVDPACVTLGAGPSYVVRTSDRATTSQPYIFVAEQTRNASGAAAQVSGIRTQTTPYRPLATGEYCISYSGSSALRLTGAKPVTDALGVVGSIVAPGNACLAAPGIAREYSNDLPTDDPNIFSPFHIGVVQVLGRLAAAGIPVVQGTDPLSGEHVAVWTDATGLEHQMWWSDGASAGAALSAFANAGYSIGIWRLGREDPSFWAHPLLAPAS